MMELRKRDQFIEHFIDTVKQKLYDNLPEKQITVLMLHHARNIIDSHINHIIRSVNSVNNKSKGDSNGK